MEKHGCIVFFYFAQFQMCTLFSTLFSIPKQSSIFLFDPPKIVNGVFDFRSEKPLIWKKEKQDGMEHNMEENTLNVKPHGKQHGRETQNGKQNGKYQLQMET